MILCHCGMPARPRQRTCKPCHAAYMREWRNTHSLTPEQRLKDKARSYAGVYLRRGKLDRKPCVICGSVNTQMHHEDYSKPLDVVWLCRECHMELHRVRDIEMVSSGIRITLGDTQMDECPPPPHSP